MVEKTSTTSECSSPIPAIWVSTIALATLIGSPAHAQGVEQPANQTPPAATNTLQEVEIQSVVVTGSRIRSNYNAPTPTQVIGTVELENRGATNVATILQEIPSINATRSGIASNGVRTQTPGQNFADLRGLGTPRTLVLVNGRRFVPTVPSSSVGNPYQVDLNLMPSLMIDHVDVVTGGASAQWGSDAVAGVVNMVLKKRVEGIQGESQVGVSQEGDALEKRFGLVGGFSFNEDRGHVVMSGDYVKNDGIELFKDRDWASRYCNFFNDPGSTVANGRPKQLLACDTQAGNRTPGGLIVSATGGTAAQRSGLVGMQFDSATSVSPFVRGQYNPFSQTVTATTTSQGFQATQSGGENPELEKISLLIALERQVFFGHVDYDLTEDLNVFFDASYGKSTGSQNSRPARDQGGVYNPVTGTGTQVRIYADNAYLPAALRPYMPLPAGPVSTTVPTGGQSFVMSRNSYDLPQPHTDLSDEAYTLTAGIEGKFADDWTWDASFIHGRNEYHRVSYNARDRNRYALAVDAVTNPATGQIVCRSTLTDPNNGCVPVNLFGSGSPSQAATDYFQFTAEALVEYIQDAAQLNITGSPFATWADDVAVAAGLEWRSESADSDVDDRSAAGVWESSVGSEFEGDFSVAEGYVETTVPLAKDVAFAKSLLLNGAVRRAEYSGDADAAGGQTTWKIGSTYEPFDGLLLRATHSLDIRAPSLYELKVPPVFSQQNIIYDGRQFTGVRIANEGNLDLQPERSKTLTFGASFTPGFVPGLRFAVDYFDIKVEDVITTLGAIEIARNCEAGLDDFCALMTFDPSTGNVLAISDQFLNLSSYSTRGYDFTTGYSMPLLGGDFSVRAAATYVDSFKVVTPNTPPVISEYAGMNGTTIAFAVPHWKANATATYARDRMGVSLQVRWVGPGRIDNGLSEVATATSQPDVSAKDNHVPDYFVFNLSGTVDVLADERAQVFWNVDNVFNKDPLLVPNLSSGIQTNGALYDVLGRYFRLGVRIKF